MCDRLSEKDVSNIIIILTIYFIFHFQQKMLNSQNLNEEDKNNNNNELMMQCLQMMNTEIGSAKTIEHERKDGEDKNKRLAEKLRRSRIIGKKMLMEKEVQKIAGKNKVKKIVQFFEDRLKNNSFMPNVTEM